MSLLENYRKIAGNDIIEEIIQEAKPLQGKYITHVNSTYYGGGVAEILDSLIYLMNEIGIYAGWRLLKGNENFFQATKLFHNGCQGKKIKLTPEIKGVYEETNRRNSKFMHLEQSDAIIIHDPQVLPLIDYYPKNQPWLWRCHIDLTAPDAALWQYLRNFIEKYDRVIVSDKAYKKSDLQSPQEIIMPSIDPLHEKNKKLSLGQARKIISSLGINTQKPIVSQISRFDYWKDPIGVIEAFQKAKKKADCQLVLLGNYATDDPEGYEMHEKVCRRAKGRKDIKILANVKNNNSVVNALQTFSAIVLQKSIREGFGLTVSESLWKETPVIGGKTGGISNQIVEGENGYLVKGVDQCAQRVVELLKDEKKRKKMGENGREYVRKNFLITRHLLDYLRIFKKTLGILN